METQDFPGFPPDTMQFFRDLKKNNEREWFERHKEEYRSRVVEPAQAFILALGTRLDALHPGIRFDTSTSGQGSLFRIYRDVRFSKDKSPYKTHLGIVFWLDGRLKKTESAGYYFGLSDGEPQIHGGFHRFTRPALASYRASVADPSRAAELAEILRGLRREGYVVGGQNYKRVPRGFDPEHEHAHLLRHDGVMASSPKIPLDITSSTALVDVCFEHCMAMSPLVRWLGDL